ncbi:hypothetical protein NDA14_000453 [Ustilago hordei]|nr:hypothetical protein NDA14_000453 [Ustilago hordei]
MTTQMDHRTGDLKSVQANLADGEVKNEEAYQWGKPGPNSDMWCTIASAHHLILDCVVSKSTKAQMGHGSGTHAKDPLELIHIDLAMHWSMKTEVTCLLVTIDDASSFTYVKPLQTKSDALQVLKEWIQYAEVSAVAISWQNDAGFQWQKTLPYTSKQNGKAEHTIRTIREMMITMMHMHHLPQMFWPFAAKATTFMKNLLPNVENWVPYHLANLTILSDMMRNTRDGSSYPQIIICWSFGPTQHVSSKTGHGMTAQT